jgi:hypothetical protein
VFGLIPVAPPPGNVDVTPGGCGWCVVNDQVTGAPSGVPSAAFTAVDSCAVYVVPKLRLFVGVSVAVDDVES